MLDEVGAVLDESVAAADDEVAMGAQLVYEGLKGGNRPSIFEIEFFYLKVLKNINLMYRPFKNLKAY
jgi:hypothetical protein